MNDFIVLDSGEQFRLLPVSARAHEWANEQRVSSEPLDATAWYDVLHALRMQGLRYERRVQ